MKAILKKIVPAKARRFIKDVAQMAAYGLPSPIKDTIHLTPKAQSWLDTLRKDGILKIENDADFCRIAEYLDETYFKPIENDPGRFLGTPHPVYPFGDDEHFVWDTNKDIYSSGGTQILCYISFTDSACSPLFLNDDLSQVLYCYYGRQPYYRNQPLIQKVAMVPNQSPISNGSFHVDHLHQVTMMLLVSDITEKDTHMEYCQGSNRRNLLREGIELSPEECASKISDYPIFRCTGKKGTLFVFDTSGFHRANYIADSTRKVLHLNITTGHNMVKFIDRKTSFLVPDQSARYARKMFRYLNPG